MCEPRPSRDMAALLVTPSDFLVLPIFLLLPRAGSSFGPRFHSLLARVFLHLSSAPLLWIYVLFNAQRCVPDIRVGYHFRVGASPERYGSAGPGLQFVTAATDARLQWTERPPTLTGIQLDLTRHPRRYGSRLAFLLKCDCTLGLLFCVETRAPLLL
ncbi:hypothetical protein NDU88_008540 [Pleurodeles waltl]|uniref:Uncharacterized protein n=1 Tax=Pleurodeles waltl TaxID=8319 RepID=A0AAV7NZJ8_PLEWA|nr:hypothetical protein NDU88_008540 [Pleurodeles waltl]